MNYYLGFDGGGTKTEGVVIDASGRVLARAEGGPSNPLRVGFDAAFAAFHATATMLLVRAHLEARDFQMVVAGVAGAGRPSVAGRLQTFLQKAFPQSSVHVTTDLEIALEAAGEGAAVVLIAGTGSSAFGRDARGRTARAGGYGPWIGDTGSAYDIGRRAVAAAARGRDLGELPGPFTEKILATLELSSWEQLTERIAADPDTVFPRIFPLVADAADAGEPSACEILESAAEALAELAATVVRRLELAEVEFTLAKSGGVFARRTVLEAKLDPQLAAAFPRARIGPLSEPPSVGAARLAARLAGAHPGHANHVSEG